MAREVVMAFENTYFLPNCDKVEVEAGVFLSVGSIYRDGVEVFMSGDAPCIEGLREDRDSWRSVSERIEGENIDLRARVKELEDLVDDCEAHIVMNDVDGAYFREHFNKHRFKNNKK